MSSGPLIVVGGALANRPRNGGGAWVRLSWVRGLDRLGYRVYFVEELSSRCCVDDDGRSAPFEQSANLAWFNDVMRGSGIADRSCLIFPESRDAVGMSLGEVERVASEADLLLNLSGNLTLPSLMRRFHRKVYVDLDPGFTQFWHAHGGGNLGGHDLYVTVGANIGSDGCSIPTGGIPWHTTDQPVVLDDWPVTEGEPGLVTTVGSWRGPFGPIEHAGRSYGLKAHEFRRFAGLPARAPQSFEAALDIHPADARDRELLVDNGWRLREPELVAGDPGAFRSYVQQSGAEFSVAKGVYVDTSSGWFSDRTARYLASGKPALVQDTGFSRRLPCGEGLISFRTFDEAVAGAASISAQYEEHAAAARRIAVEHLDSDVVLPALLDKLEVAA